jgi:membrane fusion protein (multidrug efflux system)
VSESEEAPAPALRVVSPSQREAAPSGPSRPSAPPSSAPPPSPPPPQAAAPPPGPAKEAPPPRSLFSRLRWPLIIIGPIIIVAIAAWFFLNAGKTQTTDDAYVQIARAPVSASINGRVIEVFVRENQRVRAGDRLFRLDVRDAEAEAAQAQAQMEASRVQVRALQQAYTQQQAMVASAQEQVNYASREAARQQALFAAGVASRQQADQARHALDQARTQLVNAQQQARTARANFGGYGPNDNPNVLAARANLERARLTVSHGVVVAPTDGIVTRVEQLQPGAYINASQTLFWLIRGSPWVEANFKEDQLGYMRTGQQARIHVDSCPGVDLAGHVASFSPGTGSAFSALPAQNATGNWVKVTQRLPVRIEFNRPPPERCSRAGLSASVTVDVQAERDAARRAGRH